MSMFACKLELTARWQKMDNCCKRRIQHRSTLQVSLPQLDKSENMNNKWSWWTCSKTVFYKTIF